MALPKPGARRGRRHTLVVPKPSMQRRSRYDAVEADVEEVVDADEDLVEADEDEALQPSLPDSGTRRGRRHAPVLPVPGMRRTGPVETTSRHVREETSRGGLYDGCVAQIGEVPMQAAVVGVDK